MEIVIMLLLVQAAAVLVLFNSLFTYTLFLIKRNRQQKFHEIKNTFATVISTYLYPRQGEEFTFLDVQKALRTVGVREEKPRNVQYLINLMILTQSALAGKDHHKLRLLYKQIPPYRASISKLKKKEWFQIATGIREIYEMDQRRFLPEVIPFRNHKNIYVRREAEIALVVFLGGESLRFLPYLNHRISLWQQIKIVEKLHDICESPNMLYLRRAYDSKNPYTLQLIIRIIKKYKFYSEADFVFTQLEHSDYEVRKTAIYCLFSLNAKKPVFRERIQQQLPRIPSEIQQRQVLKYLGQTAGFPRKSPTISKAHSKTITRIPDFAE